MVKHRQGQFSVGDRNTNTIEGFLSLMKRGISGTYISVSEKHMQAYLGEFEFRYNMSKMPYMMFPLPLNCLARGA